MKKKIILIALSLSFTCFSIQMFAQSATIKALQVEELKAEHCASSNPEQKIMLGSSLEVHIVFTDQAAAKSNQNAYSVLIDAKLEQGKLKGREVIFEFQNPFLSKEEKIFTCKILFTKDLSKPKVQECVYSFVLKLDEEGKKTETTSAQVDYIALAQVLGFSIDLNHLLPDQTICLLPDAYPCMDSGLLAKIIEFEEALVGKGKSLNESQPRDFDKTQKDRFLNIFPRNKIFYDAKKNDLYWFNQKGIPTVQSRHSGRSFTIHANSPMAFEIINVNPLMYTFSIKDSSATFFQDNNAMLDKYLSPFNVGDGVAASVGVEEAKAKRINVVRAGVLTVNLALNDFLYHLADASQYLNFTLTTRKIQARQIIDKFLMAKPLDKPAAKTFDQFMRSELEVNGQDSTLYKQTKKLYNSLAGDLLHMQSMVIAQKDKDRIDFKINILSRDQSLHPNMLVNQIVPVYITRQFKVDVSTGFFYSRLRNDSYSLRIDSNLTSSGSGTTVSRGKRLIDDRRNSGEFGFSSYLHFYRKSSMPGFNWGAHIGVGLSLDDQVKPRYFTGLSFLIGKETGRVAVNIGVGMGNVDKISNVYDQNNEHPSSSFKLIPSSETTVKYVSKFDISPAIGLSYNIPFGLKKRTQNESAEPASKKAVTKESTKPAVTENKGG